MAIEFDPQSVPDDDGTMDYPLIPIGEHDAVIVSAEEKQSKAGNEMIELVLEIEHDGGKGRVWDYLTFSAKAMGVVAAKCRALGMYDKLEEGRIAAEDFLGAMIRVKIKHEHSEQYGTREKVAYFIDGKQAEKRPEPAPIREEDIPF